ncbi:MAG: GntR family transcriptional regulator [Gemmatimonadaceae bacterium]
MTRVRIEIASALRQRLFSEFHLGRIRQGDRLPSVRELAREFGTDPRAVLAAYRELEKEGLVELRQRSGIYFAPTGRRAPAASQSAGWAVAVLKQGLARGISVPAIPDHFRQWTGRVRLRAACIECNDDQIASLCAELRADYGFDTVGVRDEAIELDAELPAGLRGADLLVTTQFHAGRVQEIAERIGKPWVTVSVRTDAFAAMARELSSGPVYVVASDPIFVEKLREILATSADVGRLHAAIVGRDSLDTIPADVPVRVTESARRRITDRALLARANPPARELAPESADDILSFIVRANLAAVERDHVAR